MKKIIVMLLYSSSFSLVFSTDSDGLDMLLQYFKSQPLMKLVYTCPNYTAEEITLKATKVLKDPHALDRETVDYYFSEADNTAPVTADFILSQEILPAHPESAGCKRLLELFEETRKKNSDKTQHRK